MNSKRYGAIDGLRTIACAGIVLMHVAANNSYSISGFIYMVIFRVVEKLGLNRIIGNGWMQYIITVLIVFLGVVLFSAVMQKAIGLVERKFAETKARTIR